MSLDRQTILDAEDLPRIKVSVPEWGGHVYVTAVTAAERDRLMRISSNGAALPLTAIVAAAAIVDRDGVRVFSDDDAPALAIKSGLVLDRVLEAFNRVNGLGVEAVDDALGKSGEIPS